MPSTTLPAAATGLPAYTPAHPGLTSNHAYGLTVVGDCMAPLISDGENIACDPAQLCAAGDLIVIYYRTATGEIAAQVKRLAFGLCQVKFPCRQHPQSECTPLVVFECLSPRRQFSARATDVLGLHKVIGKVRPDGTLDPALVEANARHWRAQCKAQQPRRIKVAGELHG